MTSSHQESAHMLGAAADLLDHGRLVNRLSLTVTGIALAVLLLPIFPAPQAAAGAAMLIVVAGLVELFLAMRVGFDAALFRRLAADAAADRLDMAAFDAALIALRLMRSGKTGRPVAKRFAGAKSLLVMQGAALLAQIAFALVGGAVTFLEPA